MEQIISKIIKLLVLLLYLLHNVDMATLPLKPNKILSYSIPDKRPLKKSLGFYEDTYLNFTELTSKYKFPTEEHKVITEDGYVLTVFRILSKCNEVIKGLPIVLMHGIYDSADEWILTGPDSFGYVLANNCYDVWAANHRGNFYSRKHINLDPNRDPEFWNYTFDEHGYFDLPAIVDYVIHMTKKLKVNYVGHSQGTTDFFVMGSLRPEYNEKIRVSFHLAPVAWMKNIRSILPRVIAPASRSVKVALDNAGFSEVFGRQQLTHSVVEYLCHFAPEDICGAGLTATTGYRRGNISSKTLEIAFGHLFSGTSSKDLEHFGQLITTGRFQRYDEGKEGNVQRYGSPKPPEYNVSKITSAVVLICAQNDWVSSLKDIDILSSKLPNLLEYYVVPDPSWSHNDHVFGIDAPKYVFTKILDYLRSYS